MSKRNILITGGAGFIGSNFLPYFAQEHPNYNLINLDKITYAGNLENLSELKSSSKYEFIEGDICNRDLVKNIFKTKNINGVIHFAAESHVDNSILGPAEFISTNIVGTFTLLDVARNHWMTKPNEYKESFSHAIFHHISTDEVYGTLGETGLFEETTPYAPNSPYSASKASSDFIVRSYFHTYGMKVVTTNCSNNYGPKQHHEKLIPTIIYKAIDKQNIPIYGDGKNIRDWLYVLDHCKGIDLVFHKGKYGETYNIGGKNEKTNLEIVDTILSQLDALKPLSEGSYKQFIKFVQDRPGHDKRYAIDATKIESNLKWQAEETFQSGVKKTIEWYLNKNH